MYNGDGKQREMVPGWVTTFRPSFSMVILIIESENSNIYLCTCYIPPLEGGPDPSIKTVVFEQCMAVQSTHQPIEQ